MDLEFQRSEQISSTDTADFTELKIKKLNKTVRGFRGTILQQITLDNSYEISGSFLIKQGGEYRKLPYNVPTKGFCDAINKNKMFADAVAENSDLELPMPCPAPPVILTNLFASFLFFTIF